VIVEPGLDLHEWETRWTELQEMAAEDPDQALPEIVRFIAQALRERKYDLDNPVVLEGEDKDIVADFFAARPRERWRGRRCRAGRRPDSAREPARGLRLPARRPPSGVMDARP
jgi:hypothetical protein